MIRPRLLLGFMMLALAGCAGSRDMGNDIGSVGRDGGTYKIGSPYQINNVWYYPKEDFSYDETGIASWYGGDFHGKRTANGDYYNLNELTAAHPTLPMPSLARVTNLDNGKSVVVRINDRGPFKSSRLIDVSRRTAQLLGFERLGTAKVRVQVLAEESRAIAAAAGRKESAVQMAGARSRETARAAPVASVQRQTLAAPAVYGGEVRMAALEEESRMHEQQIVSQMPVKGKNRIFVQAGAFSQRDNAARLLAQLSGIAPASVSDSVVNGARYYRVRLGPLASVDQADKILQKVVRAGVAGPKVVVD